MAGLEALPADISSYYAYLRGTSEHSLRNCEIDYYSLSSPQSSNIPSAHSRSLPSGGQNEWSDLVQIVVDGT